MKVVIASKALVVGEYQKKVVAIAQAPDMEVTAVVPPSWRDPAYERTLERTVSHGYRLLVSPILLNGHFHLFFFPELGRILDAERPDILHVDEEPYNLATFLAVWEAQRRGIPTIFFTWQNLRRDYTWPFSWMERYVYRRAARAIAGTPAAAKVLAAKGFTGPVSVIPQFGVDPQLFSPADPSAERRGIRDRFTIGFAGRLVPEKGLAVLLDALSLLPARFELRVLGAGPAHRAAVAQSQSLGIAPRIEFEHPIPSALMAGWLRRLDVLVLPSVSRPNWAEQFGRVLVEAMACGIPVVGSSCGEISDVVGDAGLVVPEGDVQTLADALARIERDNDLRETLARCGRQRVLERYTHARVAAATVDVYRRALEKSARASAKTGLV